MATMPETDDAPVVTLVVNGATKTLAVPAGETLLRSLRRELGLMSVRSTCNIGICGACTVEIDGQPVSACLTLTAMCQGKSVLTAEGLLDADGRPDPVQEAFIEHSAFQCSYCTPGMVLTTRALLAEKPDPTDDEIREYLAGNLCRCGSYPDVLKAVRSLRSSAAMMSQSLQMKEAADGE